MGCDVRSDVRANVLAVDSACAVTISGATASPFPAVQAALNPRTEFAQKLVIGHIILNASSPKVQREGFFAQAHMSPRKLCRDACRGSGGGYPRCKS